CQRIADRTRIGVEQQRDRHRNARPFQRCRDQPRRGRHHCWYLDRRLGRCDHPCGCQPDQHAGQLHRGWIQPDQCQLAGGDRCVGRRRQHDADHDSRQPGDQRCGQRHHDYADLGRCDHRRCRRRDHRGHPDRQLGRQHDAQRRQCGGRVGCVHHGRQFQFQQHADPDGEQCAVGQWRGGQPRPDHHRCQLGPDPGQQPGRQHGHLECRTQHQSDSRRHHRDHADRQLGRQHHAQRRQPDRHAGQLHRGWIQPDQRAGAGGSITANLLTGHSIGNTTLDGNNHINILGGFSADFSLTNGQTLTVEGPLDGGPVVALTTTAGDLIINGTVTGATTTLTSSGAIIEGTHGVITADNLTGSSAGSTSLLGANQVAALGAFVSGGDFAFNTIRTLTVNDAPSANGGAGDLTLTASGANSDLILASTLTGNTVTLGAGRNINQTAGAIHANTLTGSSVGSTALGGANHIGTLGNFTAANFGLTNAQALAVTGSVDGGASTTLKTTSGNLAINGTVKGTTTTLASAGAITEGAGGSIVAGMLTGSSAGATTLNGANRIGTLGGFTAASFALTNAQTLAVSGTLDGGASTSLKTTSGDLAINGPVKGTATSLTSAGAISEGAAGVITAGTLTGSSVGATTLNGANQIGTLGSFTAANFALTSAQALTVDGPLDGGASTSLKTTSGDLAINGSVKGTAT